MRAGMNIDSRHAVGIFRHDPGMNGYSLFPDLVGHPVDVTANRPG